MTSYQYVYRKLYIEIKSRLNKDLLFILSRMISWTSGIFPENVHVFYDRVQNMDISWVCQRWGVPIT